jgi:hypothetical protein
MAVEIIGIMYAVMAYVTFWLAFDRVREAPKLDMPTMMIGSAVCGLIWPATLAVLLATCERKPSTSEDYELQALSCTVRRSELQARQAKALREREVALGLVLELPDDEIAEHPDYERLREDFHAVLLAVEERDELIEQLQKQLAIKRQAEERGQPVYLGTVIVGYMQPAQPQVPPSLPDPVPFWMCEVCGEPLDLHPHPCDARSPAPHPSIEEAG